MRHTIFLTCVIILLLLKVSGVVGVLRYSNFYIKQLLRIRQFLSDTQIGDSLKFLRRNSMFKIYKCDLSVTRFFRSTRYRNRDITRKFYARNNHRLRIYMVLRLHTILRDISMYAREFQVCPRETALLKFGIVITIMYMLRVVDNNRRHSFSVLHTELIISTFGSVIFIYNVIYYLTQNILH